MIQMERSGILTAYEHLTALFQPGTCWFNQKYYHTVEPGLYESRGTAENIRITQTFVKLRFSMYRRGFRRDRAKNSYNQSKISYSSDSYNQ